MLAELTSLLHEMSDSLRSRAHATELDQGLAAPREHAVDVAHGPSQASVLVTGLASAGKSRLVEALRGRLALADITVVANATHQDSPDAVLHVHAETDTEALVEGAVQAAARQTSRHADLVVPADWERVDRSVGRVIDALITRGVDVAGV